MPKRRHIEHTLPTTIRIASSLERISEDEPEDEDLFGDLWEDEGERETMLMVLQAECEVLPGRPEDYFPP